MGIPSFYNKLIQTIAGITSFALSKNPDILAFDANCVIYHIHKKLQTDGVFYDSMSHEEYENRLIQESVEYFMSIVDKVKPTKAVYIAFDGVVPFAKIVQQRRRRFKSIHTKTEENKIKKISKAFFDTNCITPGTVFMDKLNKSFISLSEKSKSTLNWIFVSTSDEYGEGEQKVMDFLRKHKDTYKSVMIYGLDADLIILSMLHSIQHSFEITLIREESEFDHDSSSNKLVYMNLQRLMKTLHEKYGNKDQVLEIFIMDFIGMMNLLGNDFVPHAYSLKIKDNGIETLFSTLQPIVISNKQTLINTDCTYNVLILTKLFEELAKYEDHLVLKKIQIKSHRNAGFFCKSSDPIEKDLALYNDSPLNWKADEVFVTSYSADGKLKHNWTDLYNKDILYNNVNKAIDLYLESLAFTMNYYVGKPIDQDFYYPFFYSPLMTTISTYLMEYKPKVLKSDVKIHKGLNPIQQLVCVLPEESFYLLPTQYKDLLTKYPVYWPKTFSYFSVGKYYMYECEPLIPILHSSTIKKIFETIEDCESSEILPVPIMKKLK
jgi:5'-3' exoribonuclease 1